MGVYESSDEVFLLGDGELSSLPARDMRAGLFGKTLEDALQTLLQRYPQIIPGKQIDPSSEDPPRFALLRREMPVGSWSLDHLYVDQRGVLTLVETKLIQNPESRREVIGQLIEYAANASASWAEGKAKLLATDFWSSYNKELDQVLQEQLGPETDVGALWDSVEDNLRLGRLRLIVVADELHSEVRQMIEYLNGEMQNAQVLGLELRCYGKEMPPQVLVPRLIGRIRMTQQGSTTQWTPDRLRAAYLDLPEELSKRLLSVLSWSQEKGVFLPSKTKFPMLGLRGNGQSRLVSFSSNGGIFVYLTESTFSSGASERSQLVSELKNLGLLDQGTKAEEIVLGRNLAAKLTELDDIKLEELLAVFLKYC